MLRKLLITLALGATFALTGCGSDEVIHPVKGVVMMDGKPLKHEGFVQVFPENGRASSAKINPKDGSISFTCREEGDGILEGVHTCTVICRVPVGYEMVDIIDERYADPVTSGLVLSINKPIDDLVIELKGGVKLPRRRREINEGIPESFSAPD